jgi:hypothetical protein
MVGDEMENDDTFDFSEGNCGWATAETAEDFTEVDHESTTITSHGKKKRYNVSFSESKQF